jgi:MoxR-like ATPase
VTPTTAPFNRPEPDLSADVPPENPPEAWWIYYGVGAEPPSDQDEPGAEDAAAIESAVAPLDAAADIATDPGEAEDVPVEETVAVSRELERRRVEIPGPPPWRRFVGVAPRPMSAPEEEPPAIARRRMGKHVWSGPSGLTHDELDLINAALLLRRPLLVTGAPGTGKSTLAYSIAAELGLGRVLSWAITSRSTLQQGLYHYDAIGRLQEVHLRPAADGAKATVPGDIGRFVRLGPLGTALLPWNRPRMLLIDEIDKCDVDLPNDLLGLFEDGEYDLPELARLAADPTETTPERDEDDADEADEAGLVWVMPMHGGSRVAIRNGHVQCREFPFVVMTSNGEREFPPAFLRRCIQLNLQHVDDDWVRRVVARQLGIDTVEQGNVLIHDFVNAGSKDQLAVDQLMNALHMVTSFEVTGSESLRKVAKRLMQPLNRRVR